MLNAINATITAQLISSFFFLGGGGFVSTYRNKGIIDLSNH